MKPAGITAKVYGTPGRPKPLRGPQPRGGPMSVCGERWIQTGYISTSAQIARLWRGLTECAPAPSVAHSAVHQLVTLAARPLPESSLQLEVGSD
jgi:hypothetical protein